MSLFDKLKASVESKAEEKVHYINLPKLDGKVEDTPGNRRIIEAVKDAGVGSGAVLSVSYFTNGDNFDIYKFHLLSSCYDRKLEENYLLARTYYGVSTNDEVVPEVKYFFTEHDRGEILNNGKWDEKIHAIHSFKDPIKLDPREIQTTRFRFDSAIFRASDNGGVVYELAPNEVVADIQHNAFSIEKTEVTRKNYAVITVDNQPLELPDDFKGSSKDESGFEQIHFEI